MRINIGVFSQFICQIYQPLNENEGLMQFYYVKKCTAARHIKYTNMPHIESGLLFL
jgi:hypothetical protein